MIGEGEQHDEGCGQDIRAALGHAWNGPASCQIKRREAREPVAQGEHADAPAHRRIARGLHQVGDCYEGAAGADQQGLAGGASRQLRLDQLERMVSERLDVMGVQRLARVTEEPAGHAHGTERQAAGMDAAALDDTHELHGASAQVEGDAVADLGEERVGKDAVDPEARLGLAREHRQIDARAISQGRGEQRPVGGVTQGAGAKDEHPAGACGARPGDKLRHRVGRRDNRLGGQRCSLGGENADLGAGAGDLDHGKALRHQQLERV